MRARTGTQADGRVKGTEDWGKKGERANTGLVYTQLTLRKLPKAVSANVGRVMQVLKGGMCMPAAAKISEQARLSQRQQRSDRDVRQ